MAENEQRTETGTPRGWALETDPGPARWPAMPPPEQPPPTRPRPGVPVTLFVFTCVAAVLVAAGAAVGGLLLGRAETPAPAPPPVAVALPADLRSTDPCALLDRSGLEQFGSVTVYPDFGSFDQCTAEVTTTGDETLDVRVTLLGPDTAARLVGDREPLGPDAFLLRGAASAVTCVRTVGLPGGAAEVGVTHRGTGSTQPCGPADAEAFGAAAVLLAGPLPQRSTPDGAGDAADIDVCGLVGPERVAAVGGISDRVERGVGGWSCWWGESRAGAPRVDAYLLRQSPQPDAATETVGGRTVLRQTGADSCSEAIVLAEYVGSTGNPRQNVLVVESTAGPDACARVRSFVEAAAAALPR